MDSNEKTLKASIDEVLNSAELKEKVALAKVKAEWAQLLGKHTAQHTTRLKLYKRTLTIEVDSAPLRQELLFNKDLIIQRVNETIGRPLVNEIKLK